MDYYIIKTTCKNKEEARSIGHLLVKSKLAACVQISNIESIYAWEGKICTEKECLLSIKTKAFNYPKIEEIILKNHTYKTPQIVAVPICDGFKKYLDWIGENS